MADFNFSGSGQSDPMAMALRMAEMGMNQRMMNERVRAYQAQAVSSRIKAELDVLGTQIDMLKAYPDGEGKALQLRRILEHPIIGGGLTEEQKDGAVMRMAETSHLLTTSKDMLLKEPDNPARMTTVFSNLLDALQHGGISPEQYKPYAEGLDEIGRRRAQERLGPSVGLSGSEAAGVPTSTFNTYVNETGADRREGMSQSGQDRRKQWELDSQEAQFNAKEEHDYQIHRENYEQGDRQFMATQGNEVFKNMAIRANEAGVLAASQAGAKGIWKRNDVTGAVMFEPAPGAEVDAPETMAQYHYAQSQYYAQEAETNPFVAGDRRPGGLWDLTMQKAQFELERSMGMQEEWSSFQRRSTMTKWSQNQITGNQSTDMGGAPSPGPTATSGQGTATMPTPVFSSKEKLSRAASFDPMAYGDIVTRAGEAITQAREVVDPIRTPKQASLDLQEVGIRLADLKMMPNFQRDATGYGPHVQANAILNTVQNMAMDLSASYANRGEGSTDVVEGAPFEVAAAIGTAYAEAEARGKATFGEHWTADPRRETWESPTWTLFVEKILPELGYGTMTVNTPLGSTVIPRDPILATALLYGRYQPESLYKVAATGEKNKPGKAGGSEESGDSSGDE